MPTDPDHIAQRLTQLREAHNPPLDQDGAARLIGVSLRRYGDWERGRSTPSLKNIAKIAGAYHVDPSDLLPAATATNGDGYRPASVHDLARLEYKIDLVLDHLGIVPLEPDMPDAPRELTELLPETDRPKPARRASERTGRRRT